MRHGGGLPWNAEAKACPYYGDMSSLNPHESIVYPDSNGSQTNEPGHGMFRRLRVRWHNRPKRYFIGLFTVVLALCLMLAPSPYVVESPGPTENVLGKADGKEVISVGNATTYPDRGKLLLTTVNASGVPGYPISNIWALIGWLDPHMNVLPSEAVFPVGQSSEEYDQEAKADMDSSMEAATAAGLAYARKLGANVSDADVSMHIEDIGGPSAGMMYALGLVDKLTPENEANGVTVAGTGTIDKSGKVGAIGGIDLKMIGAQQDGAAWFLAPAENCDEVVGHVPNGLRDVKVSTLEEAYTALVKIGKGEADSLPRCTVTQSAEHSDIEE